jgi:hypothetical protein
MTKRPVKNWATEPNELANPPNPKIAAIMANTKKVMIQFNINASYQRMSLARINPTPKASSVDWIGFSRICFAVESVTRDTFSLAVPKLSETLDAALLIVSFTPSYASLAVSRAAFTVSRAALAVSRAARGYVSFDELVYIKKPPTRW